MKNSRFNSLMVIGTARVPLSRLVTAGLGLWLGLVSPAPTLAVPPNDSCCSTSMPYFPPPPSVTYGITPFDTTGATSDTGLTDTLCNPANGGRIYNDIWFSFVASCAGPTTISTCGSSFDTILAVYTSCPYTVASLSVPPYTTFCNAQTDHAIVCNDDYGPCGFQSLVTFNATSGTGYVVRVGSYAPSESGSGMLSISADNCSHPTAVLTGPSPLSCLCMPITFTGIATAPAPTFASYKLESRPLGFGAWTTIDTSTTPVSGGNLYTWNDPLVTEGYYEIRLTATDTYTSGAEDELVVYVNRVYDTVNLRKPVSYNAVTGTGIYGGTVCFDGTVYDGGCSQDYSVEYSSSPAGPFAPVEPGNPSYPGAVLNDPLGSVNGDIWNTRTGPTAVADGVWYVRVTGRNNCGTSASVTRQLLVDNTPPVAVISAPSACSYVTGLFQIRGTVNDANLAGWTVQYTGGGSSGWTTIASGSTNMAPGSVLANWNTAGLPPCPYTVRLIASDKATVNCVTSNSTEYDVSIDLGCRGDFNRSGTVTIQDIFDFLAAWFAGC